MSNRLKYTYQIIRYQHDRMTGEFINVGLVFYSASNKFLKCQVVGKYSRISNFFNHTSDYSSLHKTLRFIEQSINKKAGELTELFTIDKEFETLTTITNRVLPKDDNALYFSEEFTGVDYNLNGAFDDLFNRVVDYYNVESNEKIVSDNEVWSKYYKRYFDQYGVSSKLKPHKVRTNNDEFTFNKSWKNGNWHCFQALSFSLKRFDSIKSKIYKWSGILDNLENAKEPLHLYFLTSDADMDKEVKALIANNITRHQNNKLQITIVTEKEAENLAKTVQKEIVDHEV